MKIDFEQEVRSAVRENVMREINDLGIRAVIRQKIEEALITPEVIKGLVHETVDSYFRSAMNATDGKIDEKIRDAIDRKINEYAADRITQTLGSPWSITLNSTQMIRDALSKEAERVIANDFDVSLDILPKAEQKRKSCRKGKWTYDDGLNTGIYAICSCCRESIYQTGEFKYCPNCGAEMEPAE